MTSRALDDDVPATRVLIHLAPMLQLVSIAHQGLPQTVDGQLLGMDDQGDLEITSLYQLPSDEKEVEDYHMRMMECMRQVNLDSNNVGWFTTSWCEQYCASAVVTNQYNYQSELGKNCVCLVFDPLKTTHGKLWLRAFRLTDKFMAAYANEFNYEAVKAHGLTTENIFEEIPVEIYQSALQSVYLSELATDKRYTRDVDPDAEIPSSTFLSKNLASVSDRIDELFNTFNQMQRRNFRREDDKPTALDSMMVQRRIATSCDQLEETAKQTFQNLYFSKAVRETSERSDD